MWPGKGHHARGVSERQLGSDVAERAHRYLSYLVPGFLRRQITAAAVRSIPPNRQGLEASVVTDVKILRKCASVCRLPDRSSCKVACGSA